MNERTVLALEGQSSRDNETLFGFGQPYWQSQIEHQRAGHGADISGSRNHPALILAARLIDSLTILGATFVVLRIEGSYFPGQSNKIYSVAGVVAALFFIVTNCRLRLDTTRLTGIALQQFRLLVLPIALAASVHACILALFASSLDDLLQSTGLWVSVVMIGLVVTRTAGATVATHDVVQRCLTRKIAIIGSDAYSFRMAGRLKNSLHKSFNVVGIFDDCPSGPDQPNLTGTIADLIDLSRETKLHSIIIAMAPRSPSNDLMLRLDLRLRHVLADIYTVPHLISADVSLPVEMLGATSFMVLQRRPLDEGQLFRKRCLDFAVSLVAGAIFIIPLLLVAVAIKLESRGPVLFRQPRRGYNNRQFTVFKFRTMYTSQTDIFSDRQTSRGDPRVTRVGKWLRRLSIDELPQILNVIRGDMSLVGPRPHALHTRVEGQLLNDALSEYLVRYQVKPGITGWAQINGARGELVTHDDLRRRVALDLEYIQHWSVWFDLRIMVLTAKREIFSKHAY